MLKSQRVEKYIQNFIEGNGFDRNQDITIDKIASKLGLNPRTVRKGLDNSVRQKLIEIIKGKGVIPFRAKPEFLNKSVGLIMPSGEHYYGQMIEFMTRELNRQDKAPFVVDREVFSNEPNIYEKIAKILGQKPNVFMVDGDGYFYRSYLKPEKDEKVVFLHAFDAVGAIPGSAVLIDYETGAAIATRHLLDLGHERIALAIHQPWEEKMIDPIHQERNIYYQFARGYSKAMDSAGFDKMKRIHWHARHDGCDPLEEWKRIMSGHNRPSAFVCYSDHCAFMLMRSAMKMGIKIPGELAFTGCYDTPWAVLAPVPLTTLNLDIEQQCRLAVMLAMKEPWVTSVCKICPRLIVRESSKVE